MIHAGVRGDICRLVCRALMQRMTLSMADSVVWVYFAIFSGVERSKIGVQVSGIRTA